MSIVHLSDSQLDQVMRAARPLPVRDCDAFLQAVADGLRGKIIGDGAVYRAAPGAAVVLRRAGRRARASIGRRQVRLRRARGLWTCAQLLPSRERHALHCLQQVAGFEIYAPRIQAPREARSRNPRLLFPGYVFVLVLLQWHAAMRTPGVVRLVLDGGIPARVPDDVISGLGRASAVAWCRVAPGAPIPHRRPRARYPGPIGGAGRPVAGTRANERVELLLGLLGGTRTMLPVAQVELAR
jgi:transcription antitermination factor NusG